MEMDVGAAGMDVDEMVEGEEERETGRKRVLGSGGGKQEP